MGKDSSFIKSLTDREFELLKLELQLSEQKVLHLENLQYRLRQFSLVLWIGALGLGLGFSGKDGLPIFQVISCFVPILFIFLDARYAMYAQNLRSRRNEITYQLNTSGLSSKKLPIYDLTGDLTVNDDPQTIYRSSFIVKVTRDIRITFYGIQMLGSLFVISYTFSKGDNSSLWYLSLLIIPATILLLMRIRNKKREKIIKGLPRDYHKYINTKADKMGMKQNGRDV